MKNEKKRYMLYEDVMIEVVNALSEYIDHIEGESGCLKSIHADKIRKVLHHFESGLYILKKG